jgi:putative oxidoreductase
MSTENDRPGRSGDYSNTGMFAPEQTERLSSPRYGAAASPRPEPAGYYGDDEGGFGGGAETTTLFSDTPAYDALTEDDRPQPSPASWHGGLDLGLLVLRLVLGGLFIAHGLQKLFGWFQGSTGLNGINGTVKVLETFGFHSHTTLLAWITGTTELVGGTLVLLGIFTPAGAAAILGLMGSAIWVKYNGHEFVGNVEVESIYAAAAFALLFTGPGRVSLDRPTPWYRHTPAWGTVFFLIAAAASVTMVVVFR